MEALQPYTNVSIFGSWETVFVIQNTIALDYHNWQEFALRVLCKHFYQSVYVHACREAYILIKTQSNHLSCKIPLQLIKLRVFVLATDLAEGFLLERPDAMPTEVSEVTRRNGMHN